MRTRRTIWVAGFVALGAWALTGASQGDVRSDGIELIPSLAHRDANLGTAVAVSGNTAVVGAPEFDVDVAELGNDTTQNRAGRVHVFVEDNGDWPQQATVVPDIVTSNARFGYSVGVDAAADLLIGGAPTYLASAPQLQSGAAYIFRRSGTTWSQDQLLISSDGRSNDLMGWSVAISGDYAVVGAPNFDTVPDGVQFQYANNGQVYVFRYNGNAWIETQILYASDAYNNQQFGMSVAIDGSRIIVGAPGSLSEPMKAGQAAKGPNPSGPGAYVFTRTGTTFQETCKVRPLEVGNFDVFGLSVDVERDTFIVGAPQTPSGADEGPVLGAGAAYVFAYNSASDDWPLQQKLVSNSQATGHGFGLSVGVSGETALVGSPGYSNDVFQAGLAELFERSGTVWSSGDELLQAAGSADDQFGNACALDGNAAVVGAWLGTNSSDAGSNSGAAYVFALSGNTAPPNTIRAFVLPKSIKYVPAVNAKKAPKPIIKVSAFFDSGPNAVDYTAPATLTIGSVDVALPGLTPDKKGRKFSYKGDGLKLTIIPSPLGSSKGRMKLTYTTPVPGDPNGEFTVRYRGGGIDALGKVRLANGKFVFGKKAGALLAPELDIRKAKANLPGRGRHEFKFVAGFTTDDAPLPTVAPDVTVAFGDLFSVVIPSAQFTSKNGKFTFTGNLDGIREVVLDYRKERLAVRGESVDLGDVPEGGQSLLLILTRGEDVRAVQVRAVRTKSKFQY